MDNPDAPDMSQGDYYCRVCDSHMNAALVWEAHVTGKKHMKNVKKGETELTYEEPVSLDSTLKHEMRNVRDPVVGLSYMQEIKKRDPQIPATFICFLCHTSLPTIPLVIEHVISSKHRLNYIKVREPEEFNAIQSTHLKKDAMESLVIESVRKLEQQYGRGTPKVKTERRNPVPSLTSPLDDENSHQSLKFDDNESSNNKSHDVEKRRRERSRSRSKDFENRYRTHSHRSRSRSPREDSYTSRRRSRSPREDNHSSRRRSRSPREDSYTSRRRSRSPREDSYTSRRRSRSPREDNYLNRRRSISPREDSYISRRRSRSPKNHFEREQLSYYNKENDSKRSFSKRDLSPYQVDYEQYRSLSKRDASPKHDYSRNKNLDDSATSRNQRTSTCEPIEKTYKSPDHHKSVSSFQSQEKNLPFSGKSLPFKSQQKALLEIVKRAIKQLTTSDCKEVFNYLLTLTDKTSLQQVLWLSYISNECQKKLRKSPAFHNFRTYLDAAVEPQNPALNDGNKTSTTTEPNPSFQTSSHIPIASNTSLLQPASVNAYRNVSHPTQAQNVGSSVNIPGLDGNVSSSVNQNVRSDSSQEAENFLNSIFKSANFSPNKVPAQASYQPSYAPTQQPGYVDTFHAHPGNPSAGPYQGAYMRSGQNKVPSQQQTTPSTGLHQGVSMTSGQNQVPYKQPAIPFPQTPNISNYSSSLPSNYPRKY